MNRKTMSLKLRTTSEMWTLCAGIGVLLLLLCIVSLLLVKTFMGAAIVLLVLILSGGGFIALIRKYKNTVMVNIIDSDGVKNQYAGETVCDISWREIGDFGVVEVKKGLFEGKYIYMSRIFVQDMIRNDIVHRYDPRVCIVFPYTSDVCRAIVYLSGGKIDIR